ncbi:MAG: histidine kinase dimerization/phospho-acceptor domain-containing protein [Acetobacteraceae bacterium]
MSRHAALQTEKLAPLGQRSSGVAHEIRNPLNFVDTFADLSVDPLAEPQPANRQGQATVFLEVRP